MIESNPLIFVGLATQDFKINEVLSKQEKVWCLNLRSGDVLAAQKWRQYYDIDEEEEKARNYWEERGDSDKSQTEQARDFC